MPFSVPLRVYLTLTLTYLSNCNMMKDIVKTICLVCMICVYGIYVNVIIWLATLQFFENFKDLQIVKLCACLFQNNKLSQR